MKPSKALPNILILLHFALLSGCELPVLSSIKSDDPKHSYSSAYNLIKPGDIVVTNTGSDSVVLLDEDGVYKDVLLDLDNALDTPQGIAWNNTTKEILIVINGTPDRVLGISASDGTVREIANNTNLNGATLDLALGTDGNLLIIETSAIEKYTMNGARIATAPFPVAGIQTNLSHIHHRASGGFVACSTGTDRIRTYTAAAIQVNEAQSGIAGTTDAYGCIELANGGYAVAWNGTTDTVRFYDSALNDAGTDYSDTAVLGNPRGIAERANGNLLVLDGTFNYIVELDSTGNFQRTISGAILSTPYEIFVVPDYDN